MSRRDPGCQGSDRGLPPRSRPFFFEKRRRWIALPFPSMLSDAVDSRERSMRGPLTGHFTGRVRGACSCEHHLRHDVAVGGCR